MLWYRYAGTGSQSCSFSKGPTSFAQKWPTSTPISSRKPEVLSGASVSSKSNTNAITSAIKPALLKEFLAPHTQHRRDNSRQILGTHTGAYLLRWGVGRLGKGGVRKD